MEQEFCDGCGDPNCIAPNTMDVVMSVASAVWLLGGVSVVTFKSTGTVMSELIARFPPGEAQQAVWPVGARVLVTVTRLSKPAQSSPPN
jgi:hypothetical protein